MRSQGSQTISISVLRQSVTVMLVTTLTVTLRAGTPVPKA